MISWDFSWMFEGSIMGMVIYGGDYVSWIFRGEK